MMSKSYLFPFLVILLSWLLLNACKGDRKPVTSPDAQGGILIDAYIVSPGSLSRQIITTANLLPFEEVEIKAPVSGTVMDIHFREGQEVRSGQVLVQLDDRVWKAQIKGLQARLKTAENERKRNEALFALEGVSKETAEQSQASVAELEARIEELSVYVKLANVSAPFSGNVGMRNFSLGSYLTQGQTITRLAQTDKLKVEFDLSSTFLEQIRLGQKIAVISHGDTAEAIIYAIDPVVSTLSRTLKVRAKVENLTRKLVPGDFAEVIITPDLEVPVIAVPTDAIVPELGSNSLFVVRNGQAEKRNISVGTRTSQMVEVLDGLMEGDTVITTGLLQLRPKMPVRIRRILSTETQ